jgi:outer membrane protein insertion porin family
MNAELGYGEAYGDLEKLPFFENYFAGGIRSVRGYKSYSIGPEDDQGDPLGANMKAVGNVELFFPPPLGGVEDTVRFGAFVDGGAVFDSENGGFDSEELRYSAGLSMVWMSPVGVLGLVYAEPLNEQEGDEIETFQFTFGSTF